MMICQKHRTEKNVCPRPFVDRPTPSVPSSNSPTVVEKQLLRSVQRWSQLVQLAAPCDGGGGGGGGGAPRHVLVTQKTRRRQNSTEFQY